MPGNAGRHINGDNSGLSAPTGIALDGAGNIYVTNEATDTVTVLRGESGGNAVPIATIAGSIPASAIHLASPLTAVGNIYVANKATDTVTIYPPGSNGNVAPSATIGGSNTGMDSPAGICLGREWEHLRYERRRLRWRQRERDGLSAGEQR